ncbi:peptidoglycan DD-metalloendopeptidase family protein [Thermocrinis sp.]
MMDYITIIVVQHEGKPPRMIKIRKNYIKAFLVSVSLFFVLSATAYIFALFLLSERIHLKAHLQKLVEENKKILIEKEELNQERGLLNDKLKVIEARMAQIDDYLFQRGVMKGTNSVGGPSHKNVIHLDISRVEFLEKRVKDILSEIRNIPLGYPLYGKITSHVGWRKNPFGKGYEFHSGIDIEAPTGSAVKTTADGIVVFAGRYSEYGNTVIVNHTSGYSTLYAHLSKIEVKVGQKVKAGDIIGKVGSTGRSTGPHLHYEVIKDGKQLNPVDFLALK